MLNFIEGVRPHSYVDQTRLNWLTNVRSGGLASERAVIYFLAIRGVEWYNEFMNSNQQITDLRIKGREGYGLIQVFTGDGKGKTTAALGEVLRCVGAGKKCGVVFFDKGGEHYSERRVLDQLGVDWWSSGRDRIDPQTGRFDFSVTDLDKTEAIGALSIALELFKQASHDLIVLDEINVAMDKGMIETEQVLDLLKIKPAMTELVLTGREAPEPILKAAHLVTETKLKKHYFYSGVPAREGLDY